MFKITTVARPLLGLGLLAACTITLAADNHGLFVSSIANEFPLPDGSRVVESKLSGFNIMGDTGDTLHMANADCNGTNQYDADGNIVQGGGYCTLADKDREAVWIWWVRNAGGGTWGVLAGTGKYAGATGNGTWEGSDTWPDGKVENAWRGEIILQ